MHCSVYFEVSSISLGTQQLYSIILRYTQSMLGLLTACVCVCSCTSIVNMQKSPNHDDQSPQSGKEYVYHLLGIYYKSFNIVFCNWMTL